jgi:FkbM family methyltransferase
MSLKSLLHASASAAVAIGPLRRLVRALAVGGVVPEWIWVRLAVEETFDVRDGALAFRYRSVRRDIMGRRLYWTGLATIEPESTRAFCRLARGAAGVLDIGANTGLYSLLACAADPAVRVMAFEPVPRTAEHLTRQLRINGFDRRAEVVCQAVSDRPGSARFTLPAREDRFNDFPEIGTLETAKFSGEEHTAIEVPVTTVDLRTEGFPCDLVKIDVESSQDKVLAGMARTLAEHRPAVLIECNPDDPYSAAERLLGAAGYVFYRFAAGRPVRSPNLTPDPSGRSTNNFLAVHPGRRAQIDAVESL